MCKKNVIFVTLKLLTMLEENYYRLALRYQEKIGNSLIKKLVQLFGSAKAVFEKNAPQYALSQGWSRAVPYPKITREVDECVAEDMRQLERGEVKICHFTDAEFPQRLLHCKDSPVSLFYKGTPCFNPPKALAVVGTRNATPYGEDVVRRILTDFQGDELSVISGMALGIDTIAHESALQNGLPTLAVWGSGLGVVYPPTNQKLAERIVEAGGALVSEFSYKTQPDRQNFPQRNRIVAGMADAVLVAETGVKGGSVITAEIASSYNRDVFAVPGSVFQPAQEGCNALIRKNLAALVTSGNDIIEMMGWNLPERKHIQPQLFLDLSADERFILTLFENCQELAIDEIVASASSHCKPSKVASLLLGLELNGLIECRPGKVYRVIQK